MRTITRRTMFVLLPLVLAAGQPLEACSVQDVVRRARASLVLRHDPTTNADSVGAVPRDSSVSVQLCADGWCHVRFQQLAGFVLDSLLTPVATAPPPRRVCCRICTTGKACGNSCISRSYTCRQPRGCACNG